MKILLTDSYLMRFNSPRESRHRLIRYARETGHIESLLDHPKQFEALSAGAIEQIVNFHSPRIATGSRECICAGAHPRFSLKPRIL